MKKGLMLLLFAGLFVTAVFADGEIPVQEHQLPGAAREFVKKYFGKVQIAYAVKDAGISSGYEVKFVDGSSADFNAKGHWTEVKRPNGVVPQDLVPQQIQKYLEQNNPGTKVVGIEHEGRGYSIWLDNGLELDFDRKFRLVGMDD